MEQKEQRKHIWYFDYLRVFAMLCVIFMHVGAGAMRELNGLNWHLPNACCFYCRTIIFYDVRLSAAA